QRARRGAPLLPEHLHFGQSSVRVYSASVRYQGDRCARPIPTPGMELEMTLTKRQREILAFLTSYADGNGYAPSFEEIARQFNYTSLATVHEHLSNLERKGYIKRSYNESRAIEILTSDVTPQAVELPLLGAVAAGVPIEEMTANETVAVPQDFVRRAGNHYVLKVRGNSMIQDHISDGDFVVVHDRKTADNGDMVIAMLDGDSA